jgi:hypothetical protein
MNQLIEPCMPPPCFIRWSRKIFFFLGKRKPLMGLSFRVGNGWSYSRCKNSISLKFIFIGGKKLAKQCVSGLIATKRAGCPYQVGGRFTTKWAGITYQEGGIGQARPAKTLSVS